MRLGIIIMLYLTVLFAFSASSAVSRWTRQAPTCGENFFLCNSGDCIDDLKLCDGVFDCQDESDETSITCDKLRCPAYAFRCSYGACIDSTAKCDGNDDCADRSDETLPECTSRCGDEEFECVGDDACVDELLVCDGKQDCQDGTDESPAKCANVTCPSYSFHCKYGACIDLDLTCNGKRDCVDNSDEAVALCRSQVTRPTTVKPVAVTQKPNIPRPITARPTPSTGPVVPVNTIPVTAKPAIPKPMTNRPTPRPSKASGCPLPPAQLNGGYSVGGCDAGDVSQLCKRVPGTMAALSVILLNVCNAGYTLEGNGFSVCQGNATWFPPLPACTQRSTACPPLEEVSLEIACSRAGVTVNCSLPMPVGSEARLKCNTAYTLAGEPNYRKVNCLAGGVWDRPLFTCIPDCGRRNPNGRPFISGGEIAQIGEYPWHAAIYKKDQSGGAVAQYVQVCGASLITPKLVISAAHCFWDEVFSRKEEKDLFKVALGKFHRDWNEVDSETQKIDVLEILPDERYRGRKRNFQFDLAVIRLKTAAELTWAVNTVCVDWDNEYERFQLAAGQVGTVTGWGITEDNKPSSFLKSVQLPYVELFPTCFNTVLESFQPYLTSDKFCAGYTNNRTSVCPGDSGGGLVFQHSTTKRFYLRGIVSVGSKPDTNAQKCYTQAFTAFSKFSESVKWVETFTST